MTREELRAKYPQMAIINKPLVNCPKCGGAGEIRRGKKNPDPILDDEKVKPCPCTIFTNRPYHDMYNLMRSI